MRNVHSTALLRALGVTRGPVVSLAADARTIVDEFLTAQPKGAVVKPTGRAAAAAQDAWESL